MPGEDGLPTWNEIPFDEEATPQQKGENFDAQIRENGGDPEVTK